MTTEKQCLICHTHTPSKPENHLCDDCLKPVKGISFTERGLGKGIADHVLSKTNQLAKTYSLQTVDKETVMQDLTVKALEAQTTYTPKGASLETYVKTCITNVTVDIARAIQNAPQHANVDDLLRAIEMDERHRTAKNPDEPYKPLTISTGGPLQHLATNDHEYDLPLKMDIEATLATLTPRQQKIVDMLEDGKTQRQIAKKLRITQPTLHEQIEKIRTIFEEFQKS